MKKVICLLFLFTVLITHAATLDLSWPANDPAEGIASYNVYSSTNSGPYALLANTTTTTFQLANVPEGIYGFRVSAVNLAGEGNTSVSILSPGLPSLVAGGSSTTVGNTVTIGWTLNDPGEFVTSYNIYVSTNGLPLALVQTAAVSPAVFPDLDAGIYEFRLSAVNLAGEGGTSVGIDGPATPTQVGTPSLTITP
jgi:hypothetical protein